MKHLNAIMTGLIAAFILLSLTVFTVDQRQNAIVFQLGEIIDVKKQPGLYFKADDLLAPVEAR